MAFAAVQRVGKGANAASISIGAGDGWATPTTGNLLVVTANSDATVTITGTWTAGPSVVDGNGTYVWWRISDGTETTITCTPSVSDFICITAAEYSGNAASPLDTSNSSTISGSGGTTTTSVSVTTAASGDLIIAAALLHSYTGAVPSSPTWTNSFVNQLTATTGGTSNADVTTFYAELVAGAAGSYSTSASWTTSASDRQELVIAFKAATTSTAVWLPQPARRRPTALRLLPDSARLGGTPADQPFAPQENDQARRLRGLSARRARIRNVVPPQFNPPFPFAEVDQPRRIRAVPVRRGRTITPVPGQVVLTAPAYPFQQIDQPRRIRALSPRRGHQAPPPQAQPTPSAPTRRTRPYPPARPRRAPARAMPQQPTPPLFAARARHTTAVASARRRRDRFPLPAAAAPPVLLGPDLRLFLHEPELRWLAGPPDGRWFTAEPAPRWAAGPPATEV